MMKEGNRSHAVTEASASANGLFSSICPAEIVTKSCNDSKSQKVDTCFVVFLGECFVGLGGLLGLEKN